MPEEKRENQLPDLSQLSPVLPEKLYFPVKQVSRMWERQSVLVPANSTQVISFSEQPDYFIVADMTSGQQTNDYQMRISVDGTDYLYLRTRSWIRLPAFSRSVFVQNVTTGTLRCDVFAISGYDVALENRSLALNRERAYVSAGIVDTSTSGVKLSYTNAYANSFAVNVMTVSWFNVSGSPVVQLELFDGTNAYILSSYNSSVFAQYSLSLPYPWAIRWNVVSPAAGGTAHATFSVILNDLVWS